MTHCAPQAHSPAEKLKTTDLEALRALAIQQLAADLVTGTHKDKALKDPWEIGRPDDGSGKFNTRGFKSACTVEKTGTSRDTIIYL